MRAGLRLLPAAFEAGKMQAFVRASDSVFRSCAVLPSPSKRCICATSAKYNMLDVLKKELEFEKSKVEEGEKSAIEAPPKGWKLKEKTGVAKMELQRQGDANKTTITINVSDQTEVPDDGEEDETPGYAITFDVECKNAGQKLNFSMSYMEDSQEPPQIEHISCIPDGDDDPEHYSGPQYNELDEHVQEEFAKFLSGKGLDAQLGQYLCTLVYDKEQAEYISWMKRVTMFFK
jgi:hypothetical protein